MPAFSPSFITLTMPLPTQSPTTPHPQKDINQGVFLALIGTVLFSVKPILIKLAYQYGGDAVTIMSLRAISSVPLYLVMLLWLLRHAEQRHHLKQYGIAASAVGILGYYLASYLDIAGLGVCMLFDLE